MSYISGIFEKLGYYNLKEVPLEVLKEVRESRKKGVVKNTKHLLPNLFGFYTRKQFETDLIRQEDIENSYCGKIGDSKYIREQSIEAIKECGCIRTGFEAMIKNAISCD